MLPIRLVLAVEDEQYIEPFLHYVRGSEYDRRLMVTAFSRKDAFMKYLQEDADAIDVVLGEHSFIETAEAHKDIIQFILLAEGGSGNSAGDIVAVNKYQPLNLLLSSLLDMIRGGKDKEAVSEGRSRVIGVTSIVGGLGKTTVSLHLARQLSAEGRKVFYLNLEAVQTGVSAEGWREPSSGSPAGHRPGLGRLLYDMKAAEDRRELLNIPVSTYAYRHPLLQGDMFKPLDNPNELLEMGGKETADLVDYIATSGLYDLVIVDTDSYPNGRTDTVLEKSDKLVWLIKDDWEVMRKTGLWLSHLERSSPALYKSVIGKALFAANQAAGELTVPLPRKGMAVEAMLSYIPAWNQGSRQGTLMHSPVFQRDMMKLCRELTGRGMLNAG